MKGPSCGGDWERIGESSAEMARLDRADDVGKSTREMGECAFDAGRYWIWEELSD